MKNYKNLQINNVQWFSNSLGTIGIIYCTDTITNKNNNYIGNGKGIDIDDDIKTIIDWGTKFHNKTLEL
jgi:hypothetical protein